MFLSGIRRNPGIIFRGRARGLERAAVDVGDVPEECGGRREEGRRGGGGWCWRRRRWRRMAAGLRLCVVRGAISVYVAVMKAHAAHQEILLDGGLMSQLLQP